MTGPPPGAAPSPGAGRPGPPAAAVTPVPGPAADAPARLDPGPLALAIAVTAVTILPAFLAGALGVQLRQELDLGEAALGGALAAGFVTAAATSAACGRLVERLGAPKGMRLASLLSAAVLLAVAASARSWVGLTALLAVGGTAGAIGQPAANLSIARTVPPGRQGFAFGVKQSGLPLATMLAGAAVPTFALTVGWRWAYVAAAGLAAAVAAAVPRDGRPPPGRRPGRGRAEGDATLAALAMLACGSGLGAAAAGALTAFMVSAAVAEGVGEAAAGLLLSAGSLIAISLRLVAGRRGDRRGGRHLPTVAGLMALGAAGFGLFAVGGRLLLLLGTPLAFACGWGWTGLFNLTVVRSSPGAPAAASGITQTGTYLGAVLGPLAFGAAVEAHSYQVAWLVGAGALLGGAAAVLAARRMLVRATDRRAGPVTLTR